MSIGHTELRASIAATDEQTAEAEVEKGKAEDEKIMLLSKIEAASGAAKAARMEHTSLGREKDVLAAQKAL